MSKSKRKIRVSEILNIIPESDLDKISCETEVDKHVKKINLKKIKLTQSIGHSLS